MTKPNTLGGTLHSNYFIILESNLLDSPIAEMKAGATFNVEFGILFARQIFLME